MLLRLGNKSHKYTLLKLPTYYTLKFEVECKKVNLGIE